MNLAIIPARSGSKGLRDKNIMELNGKPLMYYSINAANESGCFDEIMVSTDSEKYAEVARKCGAKVPFLRSAITSSDSAGTWDAVREVLHMYEKQGKMFESVTVLQPTSPMRNSEDIKGIFTLKEQTHSTNVVSVTEVDHPVQWCFTLPDDKKMDEMAKLPFINTRRQELEKHYRENGAIYLVNAERIMNKEYDLYADNCVAYVMPRERSVDIDTELDFKMASLIINK